MIEVLSLFGSRKPHRTVKWRIRASAFLNHSNERRPFAAGWPDCRMDTDHLFGMRGTHGDARSGLISASPLSGRQLMFGRVCSRARFILSPGCTPGPHGTLPDASQDRNPRGPGVAGTQKCPMAQRLGLERLHILSWTRSQKQDKEIHRQKPSITNGDTAVFTPRTPLQPHLVASQAPCLPSRMHRASLWPLLLSPALSLAARPRHGKEAQSWTTKRGLKTHLKMHRTRLLQGQVPDPGLLPSHPLQPGLHRAVPDATLPSALPYPSSWNDPYTLTHQTRTESFTHGFQYERTS